MLAGTSSVRWADSSSGSTQVLMASRLRPSSRITTPEQSERFDVDSVRAEWNAAASAFAEAPATGRDFYRLELFGPAQIELCGDVRGRKLLDVGCGTGYFAREMARRGAQVTGIDISPAMLAHAIEHESRDPLGIRYPTGDAARLNEYIGNDRFDLMTSCLALQDMPNIQTVLRAIHDVLVAGGRLVASIAHPCTDAPFRRWAKGESGTKQWLCIDRYFERTLIKYKWKGLAYEFSTSAHHATLEDWFARL
jgi:2-polyprenyl-3-methyl-5-hydroxy-6-metoxy-1,4-benzoquinol methylase